MQRPHACLAPCPPRLHIIVLCWLEGHGGSVQICRANCTCQDVGTWGACGDDSGRSLPDAINRVSLALEAVIGLIFPREH